MSAEPPEPPDPDDHQDPDDRPNPAADPAQGLLARYRAAAPRRRRARTPRPAPDEVTWSAAGPDARDPATVGAVLGDLVADRRWGRPLSAASLADQWRDIVGEDIAAHSAPTQLSDGVLTVQAASTAWATQLRLLSTQLLARIEAAVGADLVTRVTVLGPVTADWRRGPLRVRGRGVRDTYG